MDKEQQELIGTYLRKRKIANEAVHSSPYQHYEIAYGIKTGKISSKDLSVLSDDAITNALKSDPSLVDYLDTSKLFVDNIISLLKKQPQLIDKFNMSKISTYNIAKLISAQPTLMSRFNPSHFDGFEIGFILGNQPQLFDTFKPYIYNLMADPRWVGDLMLSQPQLVDKFDLSRLDKRALASIINNFPKNAVPSNVIKAYEMKANG